MFVVIYIEAVIPTGLITFMICLLIVLYFVPCIVGGGLRTILTIKVVKIKMEAS